MGPPVYPPATGNYQQYNESQFQPKSQKGFKGDYGNYHNQQWSLPPAYAGTGALLVLLEDPGLKALIFKVGPEADHDHKKAFPKNKSQSTILKAKEGRGFRKRELGKGKKKRFTNEFVKTMSERFEKAIQDWYDRSRTANLEYLDLSGISKIKLSDLSHNSSVIYDRLLLFSKVSIKHFNSIKEQNEVLIEKLVECDNQIKKNQKEYSKGLQQISSELQESKPLTKREVLELVEEIAQQPKKVEEEALKLTTELEKKVKRIEDQVHRIEHLVKEVQKFLTT
ncbi:RNA-directed DNA polymerase [Tanacetum coccineum]